MSIAIEENCDGLILREKSAMSDKTNIWQGDLLGREEDAKLLHLFLTRRVAERVENGETGSYVLNLDAGWGQGKTFFLERFKELLEQEGHTAVLVNAWEDDYAEDPLLAVVSAIERAFPPEGTMKEAAASVAKVGGRLAVIALKHTGKALLHKAVGEEGSKVLSTVGGALFKGGAAAASEALDLSTEALGKAVLDKFEEGRSTVKEFRCELTDFVKSTAIKPPLFILIDELDRCRPIYAIALLERVKHLFSVDGVVFVIGTDTDQLRHSIGAVYGAGFDGKGYLQRFFDRTYRFAKPDNHSYVKQLLASSKIDGDRLRSPPDNEHVQFIAGMADWFGLSLRDLQRCCDILRSVITVSDTPQLKLHLIVLFPLIVTYYLSESKIFSEIANLTIEEASINQLKRGTFNLQFQGSPAGLREFVPTVSIPAMNVLIDVLETSGKSWNQIFDQKIQSADGLWIQDLFDQELRSQQNLGRPSNNLRHYGEMVRKVGRLTT